jgi:hypothetical protein
MRLHSPYVPARNASGPRWRRSTTSSRKARSVRPAFGSARCARRAVAVAVAVEARLRRRLAVAGVRPHPRLAHPPPQRPQDERDEEEVGEDDLDPEDPEPGQRERHREHDHRAHHPQHLRRVTSALLVGRGLGDERPRRRDVGADREAREHVAGHEHPRLLGEDHPQQPEGVDEQVALVDALAAELVAEPAADERADAGRDRVRAEPADDADEVELRPNSSVQRARPAAPATIDPASMYFARPARIVLRHRSRLVRDSRASVRAAVIAVCGMLDPSSRGHVGRTFCGRL